MKLSRFYILKNDLVSLWSCGHVILLDSDVLVRRIPSEALDKIVSNDTFSINGLSHKSLNMTQDLHVALPLTFSTVYLIRNLYKSSTFFPYSWTSCLWASRRSHRGQRLSLRSTRPSWLMAPPWRSRCSILKFRLRAPRTSWWWRWVSESCWLIHYTCF